MTTEGRIELSANQPTTTEPVTLAEVKLYLGVTNTVEDALITAQLTAAREIAETFLSRDIVSKQWIQTEIESNGRVPLFRAPIASVDSVSVDGQAQTLNTQYELIGSTNDPEVSFTDRFDTLSDFDQYRGYRDVIVTYTTAGLNNTIIQEGIKSIVSDLYNKGMVTMMYQTILAPYQRAFV